MANELDFLYRIEKQETPAIIKLPGGIESYSINLNTRQINSPKVLSVKKDHLSTVIYFNVDRFFDFMDLSTLNCVIIYQTPDGQSHFYPVQYFDTYTLAEQGKMIMAWNINNIVTKETGTITYAFKFFKVEGDTLDSAKIIYSLNTAPAQSEILYGLDAPNEALDEEEVAEVNDLIQQWEAAVTATKQLQESTFVWNVYN